MTFSGRRSATQENSSNLNQTFFFKFLEESLSFVQAFEDNGAGDGGTSHRVHLGIELKRIIHLFPYNSYTHLGDIFLIKVFVPVFCQLERNELNNLACSIKDIDEISSVRLTVE